MNLTYGSRGDDVRKLQQALQSAGYDVGSTGADGVYGRNTQAAVRRYQQANGLGVDGIAGDLTQGKLYGGGSGQSAAQSTALPAQKPYYTPSADVEAYKQQLQQTMQKKPGAYSSQYQQQLDDLYAQITGRKPFSYDAEGDALYQQYKQQYQSLGKQAMQDTMGQAAALTGGYGSSYGQAVGQQQYDAYLRQLTDKIPELAQNAYSRYTQEGQDLLNRYGLLNDRESTDYGRYRDTVSDWGDDVSRAYQLYSGERDYDYGAAQDNRKYDYETAMGMIGMGLMPDDQMLSNAGISRENAKKMVDSYLAQQAAALAASSGGGGGGGGRGRGRGGDDSGGKKDRPDADDATYKNIRDTVVQLAINKGESAAAQAFLKYQDQLSEYQVNLIDALYKSRAAQARKVEAAKKNTARAKREGKSKN